MESEEPKGIEDGSKAIETHSQHPIYSLSFAEDGRQVFSGGLEGMLRRWRVDDGHEVGQPIRAEGAKIFAADLSANHKRLVCGLRLSDSELRDGKAEVRVWDTETHKKVLDIQGHRDSVFSIHVAPDSTKFATGSADKTALIWSMTTGQRLVGPLRHEGVVVAVRFSPDGDRIATATARNPDAKSIRIYNSENGQRLLDIPFLVNTHIASPLAWFADGHQLFAVSYSAVNCFDTSSGSLLRQWSVPGGGSSASIALSHNQKFIVIAAYMSLSFWDVVTYEQIGTVIEHASPVWSLALCPNDYYVATGEEIGKIIFRRLRDILPGSYIMINVSYQPVRINNHFTRHILLPCSTHLSQLPLICVSSAAFKSWSHGHLTRVEELLTEESTHPSHCAHVLAQRALVRTRLKRWNLAIDDAKKSIKVQRSVIGYIALAMAQIGNGEHELAIAVFDLVFSVDPPSENRFLLLIKAIILFQCGKHDEAILRVAGLIDIMGEQSLYIIVRAQMLLILGNLSLSQGDAKRALEFLRRAEQVMPYQEDPHLVVLSLVFGWDFDKLARSIQLRLQECVQPFEAYGDEASQSKNPEEAILRYSTALSLSPQNPAGLLMKRSKARAILGLWEDALKDADEAIKVEPLNPSGYERRHVALHGIQRFDEAVDAFTRMLFLIEESHDEGHRQLGNEYISPTQSATAIENIVRRVVKTCPLVLVDVKSGRLCDGPERIRAFRSEPPFKELVSSMTQELDNGRIRRVVEEYFKYVTFSHVWAGKEPTFQDVNSVDSVWQLDTSPLNEKLKMFCDMVRKDGYRWTWSDTCCINKMDSTVLNQSLTMMYKWYETSAATFVHLADVESPSAPGDLTNSDWMTRVWTAQELLVPKVIRFYDRNWKPYLGDTRPNHKDSPKIMQEIANAIGVSRETIIAFHPDDLSIREKLRLASTRNASVDEDIAYSLIGIFKSDIKPHYGEGDAALGHLLEEIVARSGEVTVLDWTGKSSPYNSCLPSTLAVYSRAPHASPAIDDADMGPRVMALRNALPQAEAMLIYDRVTRLSPARFANRRLHLPCIIFAVKRLRMQELGTGRENHYRARVSGIGYVDFQSSEPLSSTEPRRLIFVHPWIRDLRDLLDSATWGGATAHDDEEYESDPGTDVGSVATSSPQAVPAAGTDDYTRALRLVVRLQQPFHALLLQQQANGEFKRIAAEYEIIIPGLDPQINFARDIRIEVVEVL